MSEVTHWGGGGRTDKPLWVYALLAVHHEAIMGKRDIIHKTRHMQHIVLLPEEDRRATDTVKMYRKFW